MKEFSLTDSTKSLTVRQQVACALPTAGTLFLLSPVGVLQGVYATYFGLSLSAIATVLLIARFFDAITDSLVGYLSDRHYVRTGSRKVFMACGGLLMIISGYFLYVPVAPSLVDSSTQISMIYFLIFYLLFYLGNTLFDVPHLAWCSEITTTQPERNSLFSLRAAMASVGGLLFYIVPLLPFFPTNEITPVTLQWTVIISAFFIIPTLYICLKLVPNQCKKVDDVVSHRKTTKVLDLDMIINNKPLLIFLAAFVCYGLWAGMSGTMLFIYVNSYLKLGEYFASSILIQLTVSLLSIKVWHLVAARRSMKFVWALGTVFFGMGICILVLLKPGEASFQDLAFVNVLMGCGLAVSMVAAPAILSDVIDYSRWKFNTDCSASFFAIFLMTTKGSGALGGAFALLIAGWYEFDPSSAAHSQDAIAGLLIATIFLPVLISLASIVLILKTPIDKRHHDIIRRALVKRRCV